MISHPDARLLARTICCVLIAAGIIGCALGVPLSERQPKPQERFAYSVNLMPNTLTKKMLVMKYNVFLRRTALLDTKHERQYVATLDAVHDSSALNAFWEEHFADIDPRPTTRYNEWFDELSVSVRVADSATFGCFHYVEPSLLGVLVDPDDMLDELGEIIAMLGPPIHWEHVILEPDETLPARAARDTRVLECTFAGHEDRLRRFVESDYGHWIEIPSLQASSRNRVTETGNVERDRRRKEGLARLEMTVTKSESADKMATRYVTETMQHGDVVVDVFPEPDDMRHRYHLRMNWRVKPQAIQLADDPYVFGFGYRYVIHGPDGSTLTEGQGTVVDTLDTRPNEEDAFYFSMKSRSFFSIGDPRGSANGKYRVGIDFHDMGDDIAGRRHAAHIRYLMMSVDGMVPTEWAWIIDSLGYPDVYNRLREGTNYLDFCGHFISNDSNVALPARDSDTEMFECVAVVTLVKAGGGIGQAERGADEPLLYLPWDSQMLALDSIMNAAYETGVVPRHYMARVPVNQEATKYEWKSLEVPHRVREYLENQLKGEAEIGDGRVAYQVETRFHASNPSTTVRIPLPINNVGRPRQGDDKSQYIEPGEYHLIGNIWPAGSAARYSPYTTRKNSAKIPYQRIKAMVRVE